MITKTSRDFTKRAPDWERLEDDRYGAKLIGGGIGGITGALGGRTAFRYITDTPQLRQHFINNPRLKLLQYGIPAFTGSIGAGIGSAIGDAAVRGAHLSDRFTTGVGARLLGTAGKEQTRTDIPEMIAGASAVGATGGALGYTGAKFLQSKTPHLKQYSKFVPKHLGKAALTAAGISTANSTLSRGILAANQGSKKFFDLENERYLPEHKHKKSLTKTGSEWKDSISEHKKKLIGLGGATGVGLGSLYAFKKGHVPPELKNKAVYSNPKLGKVAVNVLAKGLKFIPRLLG